MLDRIIRFSVANPLLIGLAMAFWIGLGVWGVTGLPIDALPDITNNQVVVITKSAALAAEEMERLVTFPVEQAVATVPRTTEVRSFSRFGLSVVTVVFEEGVDTYWARQQVSERVAEAGRSIPVQIGTPELGPVTTGLGEIFQYTLQVDDSIKSRYSPTQLRTLQDWTVRRLLLGTPGVADVSGYGGFVKQYEIAYDPARLQASGVTTDELLAAAGAGNQSGGGAYATQGPNAYLIRTEGLARSLAELGQAVVGQGPGGRPIRLIDVAELREGHAIRYGLLTRGRDPEAVGGIVLMLKGANSEQVIRAIKERMAEVDKALPRGIRVAPFLDRTHLIDKAIATVERNLAEGALIVIAVLVLLLGQWRAGLVVASVIPLAMLFAIAAMRLLGISGNLMSLGAIDFGLIVDGAVIVVESVLFRLALKGNSISSSLPVGEGEGGADFRTAVADAAVETRASASFGELIILAVYMPILFLTGVEGKMFRPMAQTVSLAIAGAFILSFTYVPAMAALVLGRDAATHAGFSTRLMDPLRARYRPALAWCLRRPGQIVGACVLLVALASWGVTQLGGEFIPTLDEGDFAVEMRVLGGSSLEYTRQKAMQAADILQRRFPTEVREVTAKIGSAEIPVDPMPFESCDLIISLYERDHWHASHSRDELAAEMEEALEALPGVAFGFQQPIQMRFNELASGARQDVIVRIYGADLDTLARIGAKAGRLLGGMDGLADLYVERVTGLPQLVVRPIRERLAAHGLSVAQLNQAVQTAYAGQDAGLLYEGEQRFAVVARLLPELRAQEGLEGLGKLRLTTATGLQIPLSEVATVALVEGPSQIQREAGHRRLTLGFNARGRDVESLVKEAQTRFAARLRLPPGYFIRYGGQFENLVSARERLSLAVPAALALILAMLYLTFKSVKQTALIFMGIPFALVGGVAALAVRGMPLSISAWVGFVALFGVAVLNGIVLVAHLNKLEDAAHTVQAHAEAVLQGAADRLRPVLMTGLVASLGFLPMALSTTAGAEVQKPLATVVIGGLTSSTLLTLFVLPTVYAWMKSRIVNNE